MIVINISFINKNIIDVYILTNFNTTLINI